MKSIVLLFVFALCSTAVRAQSPDAPYGVKVTAVFQEGLQNEPIKREVIKALEQALDRLAVPRTGRHQSIILVDARYREDAQEVVLSVTRMIALPDRVLDFGAEEDVFYLSMGSNEPPPELTAEGKEVRHSLSRDWLAQFNQVISQQLMVFPRDALQTEMNGLAAGLSG